MCTFHETASSKLTFRFFFSNNCEHAISENHAISRRRRRQGTGYHGIRLCSTTSALVQFNKETIEIGVFYRKCFSERFHLKYFIFIHYLFFRSNFPI